MRTLRIAANMEPFPDPREFVRQAPEERLILISGAIEGDITIAKTFCPKAMSLREGIGCVGGDYRLRSSSRASCFMTPKRRLFCSGTEAILSTR